MKTIDKYTRKDFDALPQRQWNENIGEFDTLVIMPTRRIHDSGYRCMDFVAVRDEIPICRLSGCSDIIHINGIGGFGDNWVDKYKTVPKLIPPIGWSIDCLKTSGLLRLFSGRKLTAGNALSSFEIFTNAL